MPSESLVRRKGMQLHYLRSISTRSTFFSKLSLLLSLTGISGSPEISNCNLSRFLEHHVFFKYFLFQPIRNLIPFRQIHPDGKIGCIKGIPQFSELCMQILFISNHQIKIREAFQNTSINKGTEASNLCFHNRILEHFSIRTKYQG